MLLGVRGKGTVRLEEYYPRRMSINRTEREALRMMSNALGTGE